MSLAQDVETAINGVLNARWDFRVGRVVPDTADVALSGGAVELESTILYADLAESSSLVNEMDRRVAAKVIKAFLASACVVIRAHDGTVTSFDGDRVMAVYVGDYKNSNAAKTALKLNHVVKKVLSPKLAAQFVALKRTGFRLTHCVGLDTGTSVAVRAGVRGSNDLIWIGRAPNLAASLSEIRQDNYASFASAEVFKKLSDEAKFSNGEKKPMWGACTWTWRGEKLDLYRSEWTWTI